MISRVSRCLADKADNLSCDSPSLIQLGHFDILTRVSLMLCAGGVVPLSEDLNWSNGHLLHFATMAQLTILSVGRTALTILTPARIRIELMFAVSAALCWINF